MRGLETPAQPECPCHCAGVVLRLCVATCEALCAALSQRLGETEQ